MVNHKLLVGEIGEVLRHRDSKHWLDVLDWNDVPCAPVLGIDDLLSDPQIAINEIVQHCDHPDWGPIRQARPAARFSETPSEIRSHAPSLGQHTREILDELGLPRSEIDALTDPGYSVIV